MASTSNSLTSPIPSLAKNRRMKLNSSRGMGTIAFASRREAHNQNFSGRLVDENLIVLRKRIQEMKMEATNYELPEEWMDWEKQFYAAYNAIVCDAMGHLQTYLIETRPSLALGVAAMIAMSVPTSAAVVVYNLLELTKVVLSGIHMS